MIIHNERLLILLLLLCVYLPCAEGSRRHQRKNNDVTFTFSANVYNVSLEENARGTQYASSDDPIRMGVPMPDLDSNVKFKIVEGDKGHLFKANSRQVGDFVFLRIRQRDKNDMPLNRELKDNYEFLIKATCKRKRASNLETTAVVRLRVTDRNDAFPMFTLEADQYEAQIDDNLAPFSNVLQVEASDADIGTNGEIYYSLVNRSNDFMMDPISGWIKTLRHVRVGKHELKARAEDRTSRIFYYDEEQIQPGWTSDVVITVVEAKRTQLHILVEKRVINSFQTDSAQLAALIRVEGGDSTTRVGLIDDDLRHWFHLNDSNDHWQLYTNPGRVIPDGTNVSISAGSLLGKEENTTAVIQIETTTSHGLSFGQTKISFSVDEGAPPGWICGQLAVDLSNREDRGLVRYHLESLDQNTSLPFRLGETTGVLRVARQLDYELNKKYRFNVFAKLSGVGDQSSVLVEVFVSDSNDHSPTFAAKWSRQQPVAVAPNTKIGTVLLTVDALDRDVGDNAKIGYKLSSENPNLPFSIDFESGEIRLSGPLPKTESVWPFSVWAVDWGKPLPRSSAVNLVFYRNGTKTPPKPRPSLISEPANEHSPQFETNSPDSFTVNEDAAVSTVIGSVVAGDKDLGYNGRIRYSTWDEYFNIDDVTGEITVARDLSELVAAGKSKVVHELELLATDQGTPSKTTKKTVRVDIVDVNNHAPEFDQKWYRTRLAEDTPIGKTILMVSAHDEDSGDAAKIGYRLAGGQDGYLEVDESTGKIKLVRPLDREEEEILRYTVVAFDNGIPQRMTFVNVTLEVEDVNDNAPFCVETVTRVRVPEDYPDGALVGCVAGRDADAGANARLRYSIDNDGARPPFRIDHHSGCVFIHSPRHPLDYQIQSVYNITIDVADNGETVMSTTCYLEVELIDEDENLHAPEFDDVAHEASVYENMPIGTEVFTVIAGDPDKKEAKLRYSIVGGDGQGYFAVDSKGIIRTLSVLDREEKWKYWLAVQMTDDAARPRSAVLHVFVRVLDKNDHRPVAMQPIYYATVKENSAQNMVIIKLEASDGDEMDDQVAPLQFKIVKGDPQSFFRIDPATGYITTSGSRKLDRETQSEHELWVSICDGGEPQLCSQVPVVVSIDDVNDNAPVFTQPIHHYNVMSGATGVVCRVFAVDSDAGQNAELYYNITDGDARFSIDEHGYIGTSEPLGGDEVFPLTIQTTDRGRPAQLAQTRVVLTGAPQPKRVGANRAPRIKDRKNMPPIPISDADQVGLTIAMMEASDEDGDPTWWSIVGGNEAETFAVRPDSGALLLARPIQQLPANLTTLTLTLRVTDGELHDTKEVLIQMSRSPTVRPQFSAQHYRTQISEKTAIGTQIYTLKATTQETGITTKPVIYSIFSVEDTAMEDKFRVEPSTGNVLVMESLDFETCREVRLVVSARQGTLVNFATLVIGITDDNDNSPRFTRKEMDVEVVVSAPVGAFIETILAHDSDSGDNGVVKYSIVSGNELGFFSLDSATGDIGVAKRLSQDYAESILTVRATDGGRYALTDTATVRIQTTAEEGMKIRFERPVYQRSIRESTPIGSVLLVVSTQPNGHAKYSMRQPCPYFDVHPLSGAVSLTKWLTNERAKSVECTVEAEGRDGHRQSAKVIVKPTNTNQHSPVFKTQVYRGTIRENSPIGSAVLLSDHSPLIISATDGDSGPNSLVGYRLLNQNDPYFVVDFVSGAIRSRKPLDFEKMMEWSFYVQASDMGQPVRTSPVPALVIVSVSDENDEPPVFTESNYESVLHLPTVAGVAVARPHATDVDAVGKLRYFLKSKDLQKLFAVDAADGSITTLTEEYPNKGYELSVSVTDGIHSASTTVYIKVVQPSVSNGFRCAQQEYSATVVENTTFPVGKHVLAVTAIGAAAGAPVTYSLLTERDEFILNSGTGVLALAGPALDREMEDVVRLLVEARSHERHPSVAHCVVSVHVEDVNDCAPRFVSLPYDVIIGVDAKAGDKVVAVKAIDNDYGENGMVQYVSNDLPSIFRLNKHDGKISINGKLTKTKVHKFTVEAIDRGTPSRKSSAVVRVEVVEKARPLFSDRRYEGKVAESAKIGTAVVTVKAVSNTNGHLIYSIEDGNQHDSFDIEPETGLVFVARRLDHEETSEYNLTVMASDVTRDDMTAVAHVLVKVSGINDNSPVFNSSIYRIQVRESTPSGAELITVLATDADGAQDDVTYAAEGPDSEVVRVDLESGVVSLAKSIDFEMKKRYDVTLVTSDSSQLRGKAKLVIEVEDVNDEAPRFSNPFATAELSDTAASGQFVAIMSVTDEDAVSSLPDGHRLLYSVIDGDETLFHVDKHTGEVTTARAIDDDDVIDVRKTLNVSVSDGVFTAYGQLSVTISISGRRQPPPRFEQSQYVVGVRENNAVENRSSLLTVRARDGVTPIHYSLGGGKEYRAWPVRVDKSSGKIHQKKSLARSNTSIYVIPLIAEDSIGRRAFSTLTLNVMDENDHPPQFVVDKYSCSVSSLSSEGESVLMVSASDPDEDDVIEYSLLTADGDAASLFKVHPRQGTVAVAGKGLDKYVGSSLSFVVKATDMANPPHHSTAEVSVNVVAPDVPVPKFSNSHYLFNVGEDAPVGTVIGKMQQIETSVQAVRFSILSPPDGFPLMIERSSGKLIVRGILDREQQSEWRFAVRADAPGGAHAVTTATIRVSDVDDNAPVFHGSYAKQSISEDAAVGTSIAVFSATDADASPNGRILFSLLESPGSDLFRMDSESGWLLVDGALDRERRDHYEMTARATDDAGNKADVQFRLEVTDVNDEMPTFDEKAYSVRIDPSKLREGQTIARLKVTDLDLPPFNLTRLFISRGNEDGLFRIDGDGRVTVARLRFPENGHVYNLTVLAFDGKHSTTAPLMITIEPTTRFECPVDDLRLDVQENAKKGTVLVEGQSTGTMTWQLVSTEELPFVVDAASGALSLSGKIDAETRSTYTFSLRSSSSSMECWRRVAVRVADVNDNSPVFSQKEYAVTVKENQPASPKERDFLVRVHAEDKDSGHFGRVHYTLSDGYGAFVMDERSGTITITRALDREERDSYVLHVLASDSDPKKPRSSKAVVRVSVADQNDNSPIFEKKEYNLQVMESESVGYELVKVVADGGDSGEKVVYSIDKEGKHNQYVRLDSKTGVLKLAKGLDFEKEKLLSLEIVATDSGTPPLSSKTTVTVQVLDENDNVPVFAKNSYKAQLDENAPIGTKVVKVEASDADSEHYGRVAYSLTGENGPFAVDRESGWITVAGEVDYEETESHRLTVEARDGGNLSSQVTVLVTVTDVNDNPPKFAMCNMTAIVQEGVSPGYVVQSLLLKDADGASFGAPFLVELRGEGHRTFHVDQEMNIITAARLDHSKKDKFLLTVIASDKGGLKTDCPLTVYVKEESRHPPQMTPLRISINTLKGEFRAGIVGRMKAEDKDSGDMLQYSLLEGSIRGPLPTSRVPSPVGTRPHVFTIDAETGEIWADHSIPAGLHAFNVTVTDGKFKPVSYVEIEVFSLEQDQLDHAVSIRILDVSPSLFFSRLSAKFARVFSQYINVRPENINILSVQEVESEESSRHRRSPSPEAIDVLFTVSRGFDGVDRGMLKPDHIYKRLKQEFHAIAMDTNLKYQLTTEVCTPGVCQQGECRERIEMSDQQLSIVSVDGVSFVAPRHSRFAFCACNEGYGGSQCELEVNACARGPCEPFEMCSADEESPSGYECFCPPGTTGDRCRQPACGNEGRCLEEAELSVAGNGFFEMSITNDVETRMELEVELRTVTADGTLMHAEGLADYHSLRVDGGRMRYIWDAGAGAGTVNSTVQISDGKWHRVRISRRGRRTRMIVDGQDTQEAWSPEGAEVLNLQSSGRQLIFGARVSRGNGTSMKIRDGVAACFRAVSLDGRGLAKTRQGLRLHAASPGCRAMAATPCSEAKCQNGATCLARGKSYTCLCPSRFEGDFCQVDREPCADQPCPVGIQCIPFYNEYLCKCPNGFTGKRCEGRNKMVNLDLEDDVCAARPCGDAGDCIAIPRQSVRNAGFICNCTQGLQSTPCDDKSLPAVLSSISSHEIIAVGGVILLIFCVVVAIICVCRCIKRRRRDPKYGEHVSVPHMRNPHVLPTPPVAPAPPLPPRGFRGNKYSNLEHAQLTGLPTVQVRPFPANERLSSRGDSRSPSLAGSGKQWKVSHEYGSAADDIHQSGRGSYDAKALDALRRFGFRPSDDDSSSVGSGPSRVRRADRRPGGRDALETLNQERCPLGDSIQCLPTTVEGNSNDRWNDGVDRIGEAVKQERLRLEGLTGRMHIGDTVLSPLVNDNDYMTMRPRRDRAATDSAESQRRPLLANDGGDSDGHDGPDTEPPPPPPAHKNIFTEGGPLYDDPAADSRRLAASRDTSRRLATDDVTDNSICDIDASDAEDIPIDITV